MGVMYGSAREWLHLTRKTSAEKTLAVEPAWREILAPCVDLQPANRPAVAALLAEWGRLSG